MATTVHYVPDGGGDAALSQLPWIMAPPHAGLLGHLFYYDSRNAWKMAGLTSLHMFSGGESPDGRVSMKILWEMRHGTPSAVLKVQATKLNGPGSSFQEFESTSSDASQFPSIIDLPTPGCWRLNLKAGATMGHVVVDVVPGRRAKVP
jgi:hypothetical protein